MTRIAVVGILAGVILGVFASLGGDLYDAWSYKSCVSEFNGIAQMYGHNTPSEQKHIAQQCSELTIFP